jgi:hypothetical protein
MLSFAKGWAVKPGSQSSFELPFNAGGHDDLEEFDD